MYRKSKALLLLAAGIAGLLTVVSTAWPGQRLVAAVPLSEEQLGALLGTACAAGSTAATNCSCNEDDCVWNAGVDCGTNSTTCVETDPTHCNKIKDARLVQRCNNQAEGFTCIVDLNGEGADGCYDYYEGEKDEGQPCTPAMGTENCPDEATGKCGTPKGICDTTQT